MNVTKKWIRQSLMLGVAMMWALSQPLFAAEEEACACCPADAAAVVPGHEEHADEHDGHEGCTDHEGDEHDEHAVHDEQDAHAKHDEQDEHDEHAEHDEQDAHAEHEEHDEHAEDDEHDEHAGCSHGEPEEAGLRLSGEQRERFGIVVRDAGTGCLSCEVSLPGEIAFNEDRIVHVVPRVAGIVKAVPVRLGDRVAGGQQLAVLDSAELAEAKLNYFAAYSEVGCCALVLPRTESIHDNVLALLDRLQAHPPLDKLRAASAGEMGAYRNRLIAAYADYTFSKQAYERERTLAEKKIASEGEFLAAERAFKKAQAHYEGTRDSVAFEVRQELLEAKRSQDVAQFELDAAEQRLLMLGLSDDEIVELRSVKTVAGDSHAGAGGACSDPNCENCKAAAKAASVAAATPVVHDRGLGLYALQAPFAGTVVEKHITLGERVADDSNILTIADTSTVWVNLTVYAKNVATVRAGQPVELKVDHSDVRADGTIDMVTPFADPVTRSATARVVLDNADGRWLPGTFVTGVARISETDLDVVVRRDAVQNIDGENVVFVEHEGAFETTPVTLGHSDRTHVEITDGLAPGTPYVDEGAFHLKAATVTSNLDPHAGHGH